MVRLARHMKVGTREGMGADFGAIFRAKGGGQRKRTDASRRRDGVLMDAGWRRVDGVMDAGGRRDGG